MKKFLLLLVLLAGLLNVRAANNILTATIAVTNTAGTTNGQTLVVQSLTYTWTNTAATNLTYGQLAATNTAAQSATNLYTRLAADWTNRLIVTYGSSTSVVVQAFTGSSLSSSLTSNWGTVTLATNAAGLGSGAVSNGLFSSITLGGTTITNWSGVASGASAPNAFLTNPTAVIDLNLLVTNPLYTATSVTLNGTNYFWNATLLAYTNAGNYIFQPVNAGGSVDVMHYNLTNNAYGTNFISYVMSFNNTTFSTNIATWNSNNYTCCMNGTGDITFSNSAYWATSGAYSWTNTTGYTGTFYPKNTFGVTQNVTATFISGNRYLPTNILGSVITSTNATNGFILWQPAGTNGAGVVTNYTIAQSSNVTVTVSNTCHVVRFTDTPQALPWAKVQASGIYDGAYRQVTNFQFTASGLAYVLYGGSPAVAATTDLDAASQSDVVTAFIDPNAAGGMIIYAADFTPLYSGVAAPIYEGEELYFVGLSSSRFTLGKTAKVLWHPILQQKFSHTYTTNSCP